MVWNVLTHYNGGVKVSSLVGHDHISIYVHATFSLFMTLVKFILFIIQICGLFISNTNFNSLTSSKLYNISSEHVVRPCWTADSHVLS
jgi:uncharacterized membrane protein